MPLLLLSTWIFCSSLTQCWYYTYISALSLLQHLIIKIFRKRVMDITKTQTISWLWSRDCKLIRINVAYEELAICSEYFDNSIILNLKYSSFFMSSYSTYICHGMCLPFGEAPSNSCSTKYKPRDSSLSLPFSDNAVYGSVSLPHEMSSNSLIPSPSSWLR